MSKNESKGVKCICDYKMTDYSEKSSKIGTETPSTKPWRRSRPGDPNSKV